MLALSSDAGSCQADNTQEYFWLCQTQSVVVGTGGAVMRREMEKLCYLAHGVICAFSLVATVVPLQRRDYVDPFDSYLKKGNRALATHSCTHVESLGAAPVYKCHDIYALPYKHFGLRNISCGIRHNRR